MRRLEAAVMSVVVAVAGACNYDNPGFKIKETDTESLPSGPGPGPGDTTSEPSPTGTPTTTEAETSMTSVGPQISGGDSDTTEDTPPVTTSSDTSTGEPPTWDNTCDVNEVVTAEPLIAAADAFFLFSSGGEGGGDCDIGLGKLMGAICIDRNTGTMKDHPLVNDNGRTPDMIDDDLMVVFGMRFAAEIESKDGPVPPAAFVSAELAFTVFRGGEKLPKLDLFPSGEGVPWKDGAGDMATQCVKGEASFRCRSCDTAPPNCLETWDYGGVFDIMSKTPITSVMPTVDKGKSALVTIDLTADQIPRAVEGVVVVAEPILIATDDFEVRSKDFAASGGPFLTIKYCPKPAE